MREVIPLQWLVATGTLTPEEAECIARAEQAAYESLWQKARKEMADISLAWGIKTK